MNKGNKKTKKHYAGAFEILIYLGIFADMEQENQVAKKNVIKLCRYQSPCGQLLLGSLGDSLCLCDWADGARHERTMSAVARLLGADYSDGESAVIVASMRQLDEYFDRRRSMFDLPLLAVGTPFRLRVWEELRRIPYGATISYGDQARRMGDVKAVRAVAAADGDNPISIIIPCHRVVGSDGSLTGYGGGMERKRRLLDLESGLFMNLHTACDSM